MDTTTRVTRREAKEAVDLYIDHFIGNTTELVPPSAIRAIRASLTGNDIQIRDYLMGLTLQYPITTLIYAVSTIGDFLPEGERQAVYAVLSAYEYQIDHQRVAEHYLRLAFEDEPDYPLAQLLGRVYAAEWPVESFNKMAQQLHPQVISMLDDTIIE